jgi:hypothetical protein
MRSLEEVRAFERSGLEEGALSRCRPVEMSSLGVVVRARPWRCRNAVVRHVAIGS